MVEFVRMLIVEDDQDEQDSWKLKLEAHNVDAKYKVDACYAKSSTTALQLLDERKFDAAVVDIRLEQNSHAGPNSDGNAVIARLLEFELMVVAAFTGEANAVSIPNWAQTVVKTFTKGSADDEANEGTDAVMSWLGSQVSMIQTIRSAQQTIRCEMAKLFGRSIWPRWSDWVESANVEKQDLLSVALGRHWVSHVHAVLLDDANHKTLSQEWYFVPPIRSGIRTGDLVWDSEKKHFEIVITPRCDIATGKQETIQFAACRIIEDEWKACEKKVDQKREERTSNKDSNLVDRLEKQVNSA